MSLASSQSAQRQLVGKVDSSDVVNGASLFLSGSSDLKCMGLIVATFLRDGHGTPKTERQGDLVRYLEGLGEAGPRRPWMGNPNS
jgi:hypothetical protein